MNTEVDLDIRFFRRYPKQARALLSCKKGVFKASLLDYSLIGFGLIVDDLSAPIVKGDVLTLEIHELDLYEIGKAVWIEEIPEGLRVGVLKTNPFQGRLNMYPLSDILISLQRTMQTGVLRVTRGSVEKNVFIRRGDIVSVRSNHDMDSLRAILLKRRKIKKKQYDRAAEMEKKSGVSHIDILLHMKYINPADLGRFRLMQIKRIVGSLFLMKDAEFEFVEGPVPSNDDVTVNLSISDITYREIKKNADVGLLESYLLDSIVDFSPNPLKLFRDLRITPIDKSVLSHVDGERTIREIVRLSASSRGNPLKVIYALLETRFLKKITDSKIPSESDDTQPMNKSAVDPFKDHIEKLYFEYKQLDYYHILGIQRNAPIEEIKKAYFRAELKYHPDMYQLIDSDVKRKLAEIFTYIEEACLILGDAGKRREYDSRLSERDTPAKVRKSLSDFLLKADAQKFQGERPSESGKATIAKTEKAKVVFRNGKIAFWDGEFGKAAALFSKAISLDASVAEYQLMLGHALQRLNKHKEAAKALNSANELKPLDPDILAELGHVYSELGFPLRATRYFDKAFKIDPSNKRAVEGLRFTRRQKPK